MLLSKRGALKLGVGLAGLALWLAAGGPAAAPSAAGAPVLIYLPLVRQACAAPAGAPPPGWLDAVNYYRALACLPAVSANPAWSDGDAHHAVYIVKNDVLMHDEDPGNPWYTPAGRTAAQQSDLLASSTTGTSDAAAIALWMQAPFHALGILDARLTQAGYGSYREVKSGFQMGAGLNVLAGLDYGLTPHYPVLWPGGGTQAPFGAYSGGEYPNPLSACAGYTLPSGLPLLVQFGAGQTPLVTASAFSQNGQPLEHCVYDGSNYANPDGAAQSLGRAVLAARGAVVLIPRQPLVAGVAYAAALTANGKMVAWSFSVSGAALAPAPPAGAAMMR